jgi:endonuclease/exonuclease/phosphatase family metal-dependent hydrolase
MRVVSYNIQYSLGRDGVYDLARTVDAVRDADVICLQEVDRHWPRTAMADQAADIAALLPDRYWVFGPMLDIDASTVDADGRVHNVRRQYGQMVISRYPIVSSRTFPLPMLHTGPLANAWCCALETVIDTPEGPVRVVNVHLTDISELNRMTQVSDLVRRLHEGPIEGGARCGTSADPAEREHWLYADLPMPYAAIVCGDFNDEPHSPVLDVMNRAGYRDTWSHATARTPSEITFRADIGQGAHYDLRIDFILVNDGVDVIDAEIDGDCEASDHQPVWATLHVRPS